MSRQETGEAVRRSEPREEEATHRGVGEAVV